jgi:hypothetical protein
MKKICKMVIIVVLDTKRGSEPLKKESKQKLNKG